MPLRKRAIQKAAHWALALIGAFGLGASPTSTMAAEAESPPLPTAPGAEAEMLAQNCCSTTTVTGVRG